MKHYKLKTGKGELNSKRAFDRADADGYMMILPLV